jgi:hypothetical protein
VQDYYGWAVNIELDIPERNEGETILSWRRVVAVICVWSLRSLLDAKIKREGRGAWDAKTGFLYGVHPLLACKIYI